MRFWDDKDGNGNKLTDGRICLVIKSEEDPDMPEIRTYGKDKDEVLEKLARTAETGQTTIHRMRKTAAPAARPAAPAPRSTDLAAAVADMSNPTRVVGAVKTVLREAGFDLDEEALRRASNKVAAISHAWEKAHPEFPMDRRNQRMLIDRAIVLVGGKYLNITEKSLDDAYAQLLQAESFFEPKPATGDGSTVHPEGTPASRTGRDATSYRRNQLRSPETPARPSESAKVAKWRDILENGSGEALENAIETEPGFAEWINKQMARTA